MLYSPIQPMHIPDGFLSTLVSIILWVVSAGAVAYALQRVGKDLGERQVPLMGVLAATIFAGQMLNFSVTGGTSGHLLGAAIATILLGPWAAVIIMTSVVSIQALVFQDGGVLALGANIFNMAVVGVAVSYFVYTSLRKMIGDKSWSIFVSGAAAAWCSIVFASLACALELALSGLSANIVIPAMGGIHALIGIGEGLITVGALAFLYSARRDLLTGGSTVPTGGAAVWTFGLGIALFLAILSPLASSHPDGLEWV
ncbi:MAG: energy-coupling factor ABC transporter permease, partial [Anaerolineales bacterium]|nr:energy-coupling factor ABC transporter permease [Anaerolineales bacterium]